MEISFLKKKQNRYAESIVENIGQRFLNESIFVLNAFKIFNLELFPTSLSCNPFKCFGLCEIKILATHDKTDKEVLKKEWCSFRF